MKEENMGELNFNSQICTSREQSEKLLALGLKKETADMMWWSHTVDWCGIINETERQWHLGIGYAEPLDARMERIPAWSLHRLIEMMPNEIRKYDAIASLIVSNVKVQYYLHDVEYSKYLTSAGLWKEGNTFDNIIGCIEWLIKEEYFNKEYLEE